MSEGGTPRLSPEMGVFIHCGGRVAGANISERSLVPGVNYN